RAEKRTVEVDRERLTPVVVAELDEGRLARHAGVVDEDVDAAERIGQIVDDFGRAGKLRQVEPAHLAVPAGALDLACRRTGTRFVAAPRDADVEAVTRERDGGRLADAGVRSGDDGGRHRRILASGPRLRRRQPGPIPSVAVRPRVSD